MNVSTFRYSGVVHPHTIGITPSVDKKGVIFTYKKPKKMVSHSSKSLETQIFFSDESHFLIRMMTTCPLPLD